MMIYIDCDGVLLNTEDGLFDEYEALKKENPLLSKRTYLENLDWESWIEQADVINNSINIIKNYDPSCASIITGVHSLNEGIVKIRYFRDKKVKNNIIIVPCTIKKSQIVDPYGNILVDDNNKNLNDWEEGLGIPYHFGNEQSEFEKIDSLDDVLNPKKLELRLNRIKH